MLRMGIFLKPVSGENMVIGFQIKIDGSIMSIYMKDPFFRNVLCPNNRELA